MQYRQALMALAQERVKGAQFEQQERLAQQRAEGLGYEAMLGHGGSGSLFKPLPTIGAPQSVPTQAPTASPAPAPTSAPPANLPTLPPVPSTGMPAGHLSGYRAPPDVGGYGQGGAAGNWELAHNNFAGLRIPGVHAGPHAGGFQSFQTPQAGIVAISHQLDRYASGATTGHPETTLRQIVSTWSPPSDKNPTNLLVARASAMTGFRPDQPLDLADPKIKTKVIHALIANEQGGRSPIAPTVIHRALVGHQGAVNRAFVASQGGRMAAVEARPTANAVAQSVPRSMFGEMGLPQIVQAVEQTNPGAPDNIKFMAVAQLGKLMAPQARMQWELYKYESTQNRMMLSLQERFRHDEAMEGSRTAAQQGRGWQVMTLPNGQPIRVNADTGETQPLNLPGGTARLGTAPRPPASHFVPFQDAHGRLWNFNTATGQYLPASPGPTHGRAPSAAPTAPATGLPSGTLQRVGARPVAQQALDPKNIETVAKAIANYQIAPLTGWTLRGPWGQAVMQRVMQINPRYDVKKFSAETTAARAFASGPLGNFVRSFSVGLTHLDIASQLAAALQNGDTPALNRLRNSVSQALGHAAVPNFNAAKQIVADEIAKAVIGGQMGERDREGLQSQLDAASSPQQLAGVIHVFRQLMAGQLGGFRRQYEQSTGSTAEDFDKLLSPEARRELEGEGAAPSGSAPAAASHPAAAHVWPLPSAKAIATLKAKPTLKAQFDQVFGPGAAERLLGQ